MKKKTTRKTPTLKRQITRLENLFDRLNQPEPRKDFRKMSVAEAAEEVKATMLQQVGALIVSDEYRERIADNILSDVVSDIADTADPANWNDDDVRLAVGRVLCARLGLEA